MNNKRCFLYCGGELDPSRVCESPAEGELAVAVDGGLDGAKRCGVIPKLIIGDFDSVTLAEARDYPHADIITHPAVKNDTDLMLAVKHVLSLGYNELYIVGGLGGRLDHTLSALFLLEYLSGQDCNAVIDSGHNRVRLQEVGTLTLSTTHKYVGIVPLSERAMVSLTGFKYPLTDAVLARSYSYTVSNELTGEYGEIEIKVGYVLIVESG